jgi:hypothetical protein
MRNNLENCLYFECNAGISGDMAVAALLDLGADSTVLQKVLDSLPLEGYQIKISRVKKSGIDCCDFHVLLDEEHENHDHDMEYLHGAGHPDHHTHHDHAGHHTHHDDAGHHTHHAHRGMKEIQEIISACEMTETARTLAARIFDILAQAEAKAHGIPVEEVHFHEVGAIDSIIDIISVAVCMDNLNITEVIVPKLCEGMGTVRCQHGVLPVPVPAAANIFADYHLNVQIMDVQGEFVTPTGAAIVAAVKTADHLPEKFKIKKIGLGAGKRTYERPSILRAMLIETEPEMQPEDTICKLETNIDDCTGENLGYVMELLFAAGAKDVHYMPVYMKKNRPAWQLNVICRQEDAEKLEQIIFRETTTIGIRKAVMERAVLPRESRTIRTKLGEADFKVCRVDNGERFYPEYESIVKICKEKKISYQECYHTLMEEMLWNRKK